MAIPDDFKACLEAQRRAHLAAAAPSAASRIADLTSLGRMIEDNRDAVVAAINADFGNRSEIETLFAEVFIALSAIKATKPRIRGWVRPRARTVDIMTFPGARNRVVPQPLGVVGVIVPWNFPLLLSFTPLASIFAAGNRAMVKMSEHSRRLTEVLMKASPRYFPADKLRFFDDDGSLGPAFSSLPFDHLLFTGSTNVGRAVMASAARNLTPVTLELGGKSPAIVGPDYPIKTAAERILWAKMVNAGQVCMTVDYAFLPRGSETHFIAQAKRLVAERYPDLNGADYTSIIDDRFFQRLHHILDDARAKGASVINLAEGQQPDAAKRKFAPHIILNPTEDMDALREEIFGPILPIRTYDDKQEVIDYLNAHERPLAIYSFTKDAGLREFYIARTMSGGVGVNEAMLQIGQSDLPFGGVGPSGLGHYQSREGFNTFSKLRPVFQQGPLSPIQMFFQPPYNARTKWLVNMMLWLKR
jgi:coniferyl-aldehyde dehydrogenase